LTTALIKNNIQKFREEKEVNQEQMAVELGIQRTYLSKLENQKFPPGPGLMAKICKYFNKQLGEVFYVE
jgi:putative transcriptional regulator